MQDKLAATANDMTAEARALSGADMYWVSRDMVDVAAAAAATLPECYLATVSMRQRLSVP